jgi:hypothetical protein
MPELVTGSAIELQLVQLPPLKLSVPLPMLVSVETAKVVRLIN